MTLQTAVKAASIAALAVTLTAAARNDTVTLAVAGRSNAMPTVAAGATVVVVAWAATAGGATDIYLATSRDAGRSFGAPVRVNDEPGAASASGEQPPRVSLVPRPGGQPAIVVVWTAKSPKGTRIFTARSEDGGSTFGKARPLSGVDTPGNRGWESTTTTADGRVAVLWLDHRELVAASPAMPMNHDMHDMPAHPPEADGAQKAQLSKLYFATTDGGPARALTGGVCYCCKTGIAAGADGSIYAVWRHVYPGNIRDIAFTMSRDGGRSFSAPLRVSQDQWMLDGCPENGPALAVDGTTVHVVWPTLVAGAGTTEPELALFYAATRDGRTFSARQRVPTVGVPRHPQVAMLAGGSMMAAWDEAVDGRRRVVLARATTDASSAVHFTRQIVEDASTAQYPVVARAADAVVVGWTAGPADAAVIRIARIPF